MSSQESKKNNLVIVQYSHIEAYPPSLNALFHLSSKFDFVYILNRNTFQSNWTYPGNVILIAVGEYVYAQDVIHQSFFAKVNGYVQFGLEIRKLIKRTSPSMVLLYDTAAFSLFNVFAGNVSKKRKIWYHNHDVSVESEIGTFSVMMLLRKLEIFFFARIDFFSLPNQTRLQYFPIRKLRRNAFIIPNYPSKYFFGKYTVALPLTRIVKLVYQGHISSQSGFEYFVRVLPRLILNHELELHLVGPISESYKRKLVDLADQLGVSSKLHLYGRLPYLQIPAITASCHIGIAFYGDHNTMVRTMSTASNKIFEYCSVALPVIINKREDFVNEFSKYKWIHYSETNEADIENVLTAIISNYGDYSREAKNDFENSLNFENAITPFLRLINN